MAGRLRRAAQHGIDAATGDWILVLDADEELIDGARLRELLHDEDIEGYCLREVNFIGEELGVESVVNSAFRLFRNRPAYRYNGALHEQIMGTVDPVGGVCTRFVGIEIHHYGYLEPTSRAKEKTDRNMAIVMEEVARKPTDSFTLFNAGVEFQRIGDHEHGARLLPPLVQRARLPEGLLRLPAAAEHRRLAALAGALGRGPRRARRRAAGLPGLHRPALPAGPDPHRPPRVPRRRQELPPGDRARRPRRRRYLAQAGMGSFYSWHALGSSTR